MANTWRYISGSLAALWSLLLLAIGVLWFSQIGSTSARAAAWTLAILPTILGVVNLAVTILFFRRRVTGVALMYTVVASLAIFVVVAIWGSIQIEDAAMCGGGG